MLGIKHAQFQRIHRQMGGQAFAHRPSDKPGTPLWIYAPLWFAARERGDAGVETLRGKSKAEFYDGESSEAKYLALIRELVPAADVAAVFAEVATELREAIASTRKISPQSADRMTEAIETAGRRISQRFANGKLTGTNGDAGAISQHVYPRVDSPAPSHAS